MRRSLMLILLVLGLSGTVLADNPKVRLETSSGAIDLELYPEQAPETVKNFLVYVDEGFYDGTQFHRVIDGFMVQGGGFTSDMQLKSTHDPIPNEADNGLKNERGTLAMARTNDPNSASSQFFINLVDNDFLNFKSKDRRGWGYCVFGRVTEGMDVVDKIAKQPTGFQGSMRNVPKSTVLIERASRVGTE